MDFTRKYLVNFNYNETVKVYYFQSVKVYYLVKFIYQDEDFWKNLDDFQ